MRVLLSVLLAAVPLTAQTPDLEKLDARAGVHSMNGEYDQAIAVIRRMIEMEPANEALRLRLARNLSWSGDTGAAVKAYEQYLTVSPDDRQAAMELIRIRRWRGDYSKAVALCNRLLAVNPADPEVLALKAETLHWAGHRPHAALRAAKRAAELAPDLPDARVAHVYTLRDLGQRRAAVREFDALSAQVARLGGIRADSTFADAYRYLEKELDGPIISNNPAYSVYNDSDGIRNVFAGLRLEVPFRDDHRWQIDLNHFRSEAPEASLFTSGRDRSHVNEFAAGGTFRAAPGVSLSLMGGGSRRSTGGGVRPTFDFTLAAAPVDRWTFSFGAGREFLKVTPRAIDLDIFSYTLNAGAQYAFDSRTTLAAQIDRRWWNDDNASSAAEATLRRILRYHKPFMIDAGVQTRWQSFERDTRFAAGFFTPERYFRHDGFLGLHGEFNRRLTYEIRGAAGAQQPARGGDYRSAWEFASSFNLRITGALHLYGSYQRRNYSLLTRNGWYQGFYATLEIRP